MFSGIASISLRSCENIDITAANALIVAFQYLVATEPALQLQQRFRQGGQRHAGARHGEGRRQHRLRLAQRLEAGEELGLARGGLILIVRLGPTAGRGAWASGLTAHGAQANTAQGA